MTTLANIETMVARDLRDTSNLTWNTTELDDLINQGIDAVSDFYPREIVTTLATITAGAYSYSLGSMASISRVSIYTSAGSYRTTVGKSDGDEPEFGWETHADVLWLPSTWTWTAGDTIRAFGYQRWAQLSASSSTTDLDAQALWAVRIFARVEALSGLLIDRAKYQQWQTTNPATDTTIAGLNQSLFHARRRWDAERARLRKFRRVAV